MLTAAFHLPTRKTASLKEEPLSHRTQEKRQRHSSLPNSLSSFDRSMEIWVVRLEWLIRANSLPRDPSPVVITKTYCCGQCKWPICRRLKAPKFTTSRLSPSPPLNDVEVQQVPRTWFKRSSITILSKRRIRLATSQLVTSSIQDLARKQKLSLIRLLSWIRALLLARITKQSSLLTNWYPST